MPEITSALICMRVLSGDVTFGASECTLVVPQAEARAFFVHADMVDCGKGVKGEGMSHAMRVTGTRYRIHQQNHGPISEEPHDF